MVKIDLSKLKGAFGWLGFLRAYSVLILPAGICLGGIVILITGLLLGNSFKAKVESQSIPMGKQVKSLAESVSPAKQAEVEKAYQDAFEKDANSVELMALRSTQRELLSYDIFPQPNETSMLLFTKFGNTFRQQIDGRIGSMNASDCPSEEELKVSPKQGVSSPMSMMRGISVADTGEDEGSKIIEELCQSRAKAISLYANPRDISGYDFWEQYKYVNTEDSVKDSWFWQLGYWIIEDIFSTAESMNTGSGNVYTSPVKRIMRVGFATPDKLFGSGPGNRPSQDRPKYIIKPEDQLTESCTGRMSNAEIDVMHFSMVAVVSTKAILPFMHELCAAKEHRFTGYTGTEPAQVFKHNQISVLESRIRPADPATLEHLRYRYGPDSVVELELICEYIFNKKGYQPINPTLPKKTEEPPQQ